MPKLNRRNRHRSMVVWSFSQCIAPTVVTPPPPDPNRRQSRRDRIAPLCDIQRAMLIAYSSLPEHNARLVQRGLEWLQTASESHSQQNGLRSAFLWQEQLWQEADSFSDAPVPRNNRRVHRQA